MLGKLVGHPGEPRQGTGGRGVGPGGVQSPVQDRRHILGAAQLPNLGSRVEGGGGVAADQADDPQMRPQPRIRRRLGQVWPHLFGGSVDDAKDLGSDQGFRGHPEASS